MSKSFYDLDYIIEISEKRVTDLYDVYHKGQEKLTNLILIYSALAIFLIPIIQDIFWKEITHWFFYLSFAVFAALFIISLIFTIRLIIPVEIAFLESPEKYYIRYRLDYEQQKKGAREIADLLKASYITELETTFNTNNQVFRRKSSFYYNALMYSLLSSIPYLFCLGVHITQKDDKIHKVEIVGQEKNRKLQKRHYMSKDTAKPTNSSTTTTATTQLPGVNNADVIRSSPALIKENSSTPSNKAKK